MLSRDPERRQLAGDSCCWKRPEIAAVQTFGDIGIHQKDIAGRKQTTSLPHGQAATEMVLAPGVAEVLSTDGNAGADAANALPGNAGYMLQHRHPARQIMAFVKEPGERLGRRDRDQIANLRRRYRAHPIETTGTLALAFQTSLGDG